MGFDFVLDFTSKKDMPAVSEDPVLRSGTGNQDMHYPVRIYSFEGFGQIRKENTV